MQKLERRSTIMTLKEVSRFLRLKKSTIYRMAREGTLPAWKLGNVWRFTEEAIENWIANSQRKRVEAIVEGQHGETLAQDPASRYPSGTLTRRRPPSGT